MSFWRKTEAEELETATLHRAPFFQVQVASNYKAIKQSLHLEVKATWARETAAFFLWTYGITASDGWRVIWEQNRHLLLMQMSFPLWVAGDLQESWHFCRFRYFMIKSFKKGQGKALFNTRFYLENSNHVVSKQSKKAPWITDVILLSLISAFDKACQNSLWHYKSLWKVLLQTLQMCKIWIL